MPRHAFVLVLFATTQITAAEPVTEVEVDLSEVGRRIVHTHLVIPASPGPLTLHYPKWIPGTHGPIGPVSEQAGLHVKVGTQPLAWKRDDADPFSYHVTVPDGAENVDVSFDLTLQPPGTGSWLGITLTGATPKLAILNWNELLLYPKTDKPMAQLFKAAVKMPAGWKYGTALGDGKLDGIRVEFAPVSLEELIDSPFLCGEHVKEVAIGTPDGLKHRVVLACDSEAGFATVDEMKPKWDRLVVEAGKLFGVRHYRSYTFLLSLSDQISRFGLEHHESSDNRLPELVLTTKEGRSYSGSLLPHEYVHSWNGKYRRPADMVVPDYQVVEKTRLLWVYEGLTNYLGWVLAARSGLFTEAEARDSLGMQAGHMAASRGRTWRPLDDTAAANFIILPAPDGWSSYRRGLDYYDEGTLIWLEVDVMIRQLTNGKKSIEDFCRIFHGGEGGKPLVKGYTVEEITNTLDKVVAHDWKTHFQRRVSLPNETPPFNGILSAGWKLGYQEKPTPMFEANESRRKVVDLNHSIGMLVGQDGVVNDVIPDGIAAKAGIGPGMKLVAVNGRKFSDAGLKAAVSATKTSGKLELLTETGEFFKTHNLEYNGGARYPILERGIGPDLLSEIIKPLDSAAKK